MPARVLFIQDDDHTRKRVRDLLEAAGFAVEDTASALDGLEVAEILGAPPGPRVGEALRHLLERVLEDPSENEPQRLRAALLDWSAKGPGRI